MSKFIPVEEIEESQWIYLQYLEELKIRLIMYELELLIMEPGIEEFSDDENWYSD